MTSKKGRSSIRSTPPQSSPALCAMEQPNSKLKDELGSVRDQSADHVLDVGLELLVVQARLLQLQGQLQEA